MAASKRSRTPSSTWRPCHRVVQRIVHTSGYRVVPSPSPMPAVSYDLRAPTAGPRVEVNTRWTTIPRSLPDGAGRARDATSPRSARSLPGANTHVSQETVSRARRDLLLPVRAHSVSAPDTACSRSRHRMASRDCGVARARQVAAHAKASIFNDAFKRVTGLIGAALFLRRWWRQRAGGAKTRVLATSCASHRSNGRSRTRALLDPQGSSPWSRCSASCCSSRPKPSIDLRTESSATRPRSQTCWVP